MTANEEKKIILIKRIYKARDTQCNLSPSRNSMPSLSLSSNPCPTAHSPVIHWA